MGDVPGLLSGSVSVVMLAEARGRGALLVSAGKLVLEAYEGTAVYMPVRVKCWHLRSLGCHKQRRG